MVLRELIEFGPCISAETVKARAVIGLHMMDVEIALRSDSDPSPDLGDMWRYGCPSTSPLDSYEHKVGNLALEVVGQSMDFFCQDMRDACRERELRVSEFSSLLVFRVPGRKEEVF